MTIQAGARYWLARLPIMGNPVSKSQEFMEQRERTNTEYRKQGTLSMNLVNRRLSHPHPPGMLIKTQTNLRRWNAGKASRLVV